jgi:hypothetical protein
MDAVNRDLLRHDADETFSGLKIVTHVGVRQEGV